MTKDSKPVIHSLNAHELVHILSQGRKALATHVEAINALNVFPVPDGDTGTNMLLTMMAMEAETSKDTDIPDSRLIATMARGALMGARGNSGVILAQFFQGLSKGLDGKSDFDCQALTLGLTEATTAAYKAVGNPVEGTMLTVIREISEAAQAHIGANDNILALWETMCLAARKAVLKTPSLLPILREAGVVDAGGQGLSVLLEGALKGLRGEEPEGIELTAPEMNSDLHSISESFIVSTEDYLYGYCTQFLISGEALDADAVRDNMQSIATSTVVVGEDTLIRVHVHANDPGPVLSYAVTRGTISEVSIVNMDEQHQEFIAARRRKQKIQPVGVLAVGLGQGIMDLFLDSGASSVLLGGDTMNPSTQEILTAAEDITAERIIILPNNSNIMPAAKQAASFSTRPITVIPSKTIPQGIAALLAFNPQREFEVNVSAMTKAISDVVSGAICIAQRDAELGGIKVTKNQTMGLLESQMVVTGDNRTTVILDLIAKAAPEDESLITLYWGADIHQNEVDETADAIRSRFPSAEVEVVFGGQSHYTYIVSVE